MADRDWCIKVPSGRFEALRRDERFRQVLVLGRMLNSLRFLQCTFLSAADLKPPGDFRQRLNAFFFIVAVMYEGLILLKRMGKHFQGSNNWQHKIVPILRDGAFDRLFSASMGPLRNQAVFHFFEDALKEPLDGCDSKDFTVVAGSGRGQKEVFYELSDRLTLGLFIGKSVSTEEQTRHVITLMNQTLDLLKEIVEASESLIGEYCSSEGLAFESVSREESGGS